MTNKFVYAMVGNEDLVKVGISNNPARRAEYLSTKSVPLRAAYVAAVPAGLSARAVEISAHSLLWAHRVTGEWFRVPFSEAKKAIEAALKSEEAGEHLPLPQRPGVRSANVSIKLKDRTKQRLMELAAADHRSLSKFIEMIVEDYFDAKDATPKPKGRKK